jgi:phosphoribulokinase
MTTVICLDDYHSLDRKGRAEKGVTALAPEAQNFDLMAQQVQGGTAARGHPYRARG